MLNPYSISVTQLAIKCIPWLSLLLYSISLAFRLLMPFTTTVVTSVVSCQNVQTISQVDLYQCISFFNNFSDSIALLHIADAFDLIVPSIIVRTDQWNAFSDLVPKFGDPDYKFTACNVRAWLEFGHIVQSIKLFQR